MNTFKKVVYLTFNMLSRVDLTEFDLGAYTIEQNVLTALAVFILSIAFLRFFRARVLAMLKKISQKTKTPLDEMLVDLAREIPWTLYVLASAYFGMQFLTVPRFLESVIAYAIIVVLVYYAIKAAYIIIDFFRDKIIRKRLETDPKDDTTVIMVLASLVKYSMWFVGALLILSNMDVDISALIAGMGVGGIAIALAAQRVLDDIFASFSIYFDKPYKVGDFLIIGDDLGVVKKIGIKSTRIDTLRGEELVISNREMTNIRVHNFGIMPHRRVVFNFGVVYQTPVEKVKKIAGIVREIVEAQELVRFDRAHFSKFGSSSLDFEGVYYLKTADFNKYMDTQQAINIAIMEAFEKEAIEFAYPTQTIYMGK
jgi:small-conductance mechanosensitive channel